MFQSAGIHCGKSNWTIAVEKGSVPDYSKDFPISHWHNFEADLDQMLKLGVNSYRFSIEWSHIEPEPGKYDETILSRYGEMISACRARNIEPMITLYHFIEPHWFSKLKGFEREENIKYYIQFCEMIFKRFQHQVKYWCTFNEPALHAFSGYFYGQFPPHQHSIKKSIGFLVNLLKAHIAVYKKLKNIPGSQDSKIGIVHNVLRVVPRYNWEPIERWMAKFMTEICDELVVKFLKTGRLNFRHWFAHVEYEELEAPQSYDFIGLNFYGNVVLGFNTKNFFGPTCFPHQIMGEYHVPIDSEGFSRAIDHISALNKPIYITEIGIADKNDKIRPHFLNEYFKVLRFKIDNRVDIRGCFIWTFSDNYEWDQGYNIKFGIADHHRVERGSAQDVRKIFQDLTNKPSADKQP